MSSSVPPCKRCRHAAERRRLLGRCRRSRSTQRGVSALDSRRSMCTEIAKHGSCRIKRRKNATACKQAGKNDGTNLKQMGNTEGIRNYACRALDCLGHLDGISHVRTWLLQIVAVMTCQRKIANIFCMPVCHAKPRA